MKGNAASTEEEEPMAQWEVRGLRKVGWTLNHASLRASGEPRHAHPAAAWASSPSEVYSFYGNLQRGAHSIDFMAASHFQRPPSSSSAKTTASSDSLVGLLGKTTGAIWISFGIASILRVLFGPMRPHSPPFLGLG